MSVAVPLSPNPSAAQTSFPKPVNMRRAVAAKPSQHSASSSSSSSAGPSSANSASSAMAPPATLRRASAAPLVPLAVPGKDMSSSTGKVFARPSKEWVVPERAKPGRKASTEEPDNKRQSQNRLSQRAHRARRTDYIQTLEDRLRQYEQDEIHSNVRLQQVARALKTDNERMKAEVDQLRGLLTAAQTERERWLGEKRSMDGMIKDLRSQVESLRVSAAVANAAAAAASSPASAVGSTGRGNITSPNEPLHLEERLQYELAALRSPANASMLKPPARRPDATPLACPICPDPDPDCPCQRRDDSAADAQPQQMMATPTASSLCGICELVPGSCLCKPEAPYPDVEEDIKPIISSPTFGDEAIPGVTDCGLCTSSSFCACRAGAEAAAMALSAPPVVPAPATIPLMQLSSTGPTVTVAAPAVPLKLRRKTGSRGSATKQSIWSLDNVPKGTSRAEPMCTGDPSNCDACKNDRFGQEFCGHLFGQKEGQQDGKPSSCSGCANGSCGKKKAGGDRAAAAPALPAAPAPPSPVRQTSAYSPPLTPPMQAPLVLACCGAPELCGHASDCAGDVIGIGASSTVVEPAPKLLQQDKNKDDGSDDSFSDVEEMRPDEAWKALKAHPNSKFTPLSILAAVVSRRAKCTSSRVELSPPPPEPASLPPLSTVVGQSPTLLHGSPRSIPRMAAPPNPVPLNPLPPHSPHSHQHHHHNNPAHRGLHEHPRVAGMKRQFAVETSAVRDALKYLDGARPSASPSPMQSPAALSPAAEGVERASKRRKI